MTSTALLKKVELGPRQMTLGFDNQTAKHIDAVFSFIENQVQANGPVSLDKITSPESALGDLSDLEIMQAVFWLAEELKIHFFIDDHTALPRQTKKTLIQSPETPVFIVLNREVDAATFEKARKISNSFLSALPEDIDQYGFSRCLVNELKSWLGKLDDYASKAAQPFFPGQKEITNGQVLLHKLLEKQDSHSMILTCLKYRSKITRLSETINVLTEFYVDKRSFWMTFTRRMCAFKSSLAQLKKNKAVFSSYQRLSEILNSPKPYPMVDEAEKLLPDVLACHLQIERDKMETLRVGALEKIAKMIQKLISLFDTFESEQEYRNQCLVDLRAVEKRIKNCRSTEEIQTLMNDAKDLFVDVIEEI